MNQACEGKYKEDTHTQEHMQFENPASISQ
jgi:hypothetical protein